MVGLDAGPRSLASAKTCIKLVSAKFQPAWQTVLYLPRASESRARMDEMEAFSWGPEPSLKPQFLAVLQMFCPIFVQDHRQKSKKFVALRGNRPHQVSYSSKVWMTGATDRSAGRAYAPELFPTSTSDLSSFGVWTFFHLAFSLSQHFQSLFIISILVFTLQ
ncbi:hypothetical protein C8J56DRAFT_466813 [Mycena floridula]|nr:hypothetical protein C8J56DRAFT_466813 [Mycena floridula]